jgi:hypothetical protein
MGDRSGEPHCSPQSNFYSTIELYFCWDDCYWIHGVLANDVKNDPQTEWIRFFFECGPSDAGEGGGEGNVTRLEKRLVKRIFGSHI